MLNRWSGYGLTHADYVNLFFTTARISIPMRSTRISSKSAKNLA
jgi:hypothetical protein